MPKEIDKVVQPG